MSKSYKVAKKTINMGEKKGQTLFSVRPYSYGTLTTEEVANQIAVESTATPADVKAVLDRYAYYVKENLKKGYDIELLGKHPTPMTIQLHPQCLLGIQGILRNWTFLIFKQV